MGFLPLVIPSSLGILASLVAYVVYQQFFSPLAKIRGPFAASLTPIWKILALRKGNWHETILELHERYGNVVRIAPDEVIVSDPSAVRDIYVSHDYLKTDFYDAFTAIRPTIFSQRDPHLHAQRKKIVSPGYSMGSIQSMESFFQEKLLVFLEQMQQFSRTGETIELDSWCRFFSFDVIGELAFSEGFGMLESGIEVDFIPLINKHFEFSTTFGNVPSILRLLNSSRLPIRYIRDLQDRREKLKEFCRSRLERRLVKGSNRKDLLGRLREAKDPVTGNKLDNVDLSTESFSAIVAGSDSTAAALAFTFYHIINHPHVYKTLTAELRTQFLVGQEELDVAHLPTYTELAGLKYLQACIKESLRLTAPTTLHLPRYVPAGGRTIAGHYFPAKTSVGVSVQSIHLSTDNYGPDALEYNPERWLKTDTQDPDDLQKFWIPFGIGHRACIGKNVAMMELIKLVGTTLLWFDLKLSPEMGPLKEIPEATSLFFQRMKNPLKVTVHARR